MKTLQEEMLSSVQLQICRTLLFASAYPSNVFKQVSLNLAESSQCVHSYPSSLTLSPVRGERVDLNTSLFLPALTACCRMIEIPEGDARSHEEES
ncbi:hypothetical protein PBY51_006031 [Eleginops maclovinus]|uniref:Uncharacterized protein n=1 Tax=Eleginops maclovinus TaxID=56733 RepID=A0AAN7WTI7_ELEMC|nr:hypothetical protein PBY51_006031 [Eleginops maclovinus]